MSRFGPRNPERDRRVLELAPNHSASEIATMIGGGLTRNAVIGICARANVPVNGGPGRKVVKSAKAFPKWNGGIGARESASARQPAGKCRYPFGDPCKPGFRFCEKPVAAAGRSYCAKHQAVCYVSASHVQSEESNEARRLAQLRKHGRAALAKLDVVESA
jgi:hypothetical protein